MTREERDLDGLIVPGSDHLTAYNLYAEAYSYAGQHGEVYGLPRHLFDEERIERWAERRGALVKSIEDAALGMASIYRAVGVPLPIAHDDRAATTTLRAFQQLLAQYHAVHARDRRADGDGRRSARVEDERVRQLGADHRRRCATSPTSSAIRARRSKGTQVPYDSLRAVRRRDGGRAGLQRGQRAVAARPCAGA